MTSKVQKMQTINDHVLKGIQKTIWIIHPQGTLPFEGWTEDRRFMISNALANRGHRVVWWISKFKHHTKTYRNVEAITREWLDTNIEMRFIDCTPYKSHISIQRYLYERTFGINVLASMEKEEKIPDIIVMTDPSLFFGNYVLKYCKKYKIKLIVDIFDLWPEQFEILIPERLHFMAKWLFFCLYKRRDRLINYASGVVGITKDYLDDVLTRTQAITKPQEVCYLGVNLQDFETNRHAVASVDIVDKFVQDASIVCIYAGTLGEAYDMKTLIHSIEKSIAINSTIKFIVAGAGINENLFTLLAVRYPTRVLFLGMVDPKLLPYIYSKCDIGICSYSKSSAVSMPTKFYDYLAGGLAVLNSLGREIQSYVNEKSVGTNYEPGNPNSFIDSLLSYSDDRKLLDTHKTNAKQLSHRFDSNIIYRNFTRFVESLL